MKGKMPTGFSEVCSAITEQNSSESTQKCHWDHGYGETVLSNGDWESLGQYNTIRVVTISEKERTELEMIASKRVGHLAIKKDRGLLYAGP